MMIAESFAYQSKVAVFGYWLIKEFVFTSTQYFTCPLLKLFLLKNVSVLDIAAWHKPLDKGSNYVQKVRMCPVTILIIIWLSDQWRIAQWVSILIVVSQQKVVASFTISTIPQSLCNRCHPSEKWLCFLLFRCPLELHIKSARAICLCRRVARMKYATREYGMMGFPDRCFAFL